MRTRDGFLMVAFLAVVPGIAKSQENNPAQPPAAEQPDAEAAQNVPPAPPPPGPEVMHPTKQGLRLTPEIARGFGRAMAWESRNDLKTTPEQRRQLEGRYARRFMELGRKHQQELQPALEYLITTVIAKEGRGPGLDLTPEAAREFGQRCAPLVPVIRETMDAFDQEAAAVLKPEQMEAFRKKMQEARGGARNFEEVLNRWAQGGYRDGDNPFDSPKPTSAGSGDSSAKDGAGAAPAPPKPEMQNAEAVAQVQMEQLGPSEWSRLLEAAKRDLKFDDAQRAKADQLLADYRAKADRVMTPEWKQAMRSNRIKSHLNNFLRGKPSRPFFFHLQQEYARLVQPVKELGSAFRADLLALVTPEQRAAAVAEAQSSAAAIGLTVAPADEALLGLATTQPAAGAP